MIPEGLEPALRRLVEVFLSENEKLNLSAIRTPEAAWPGHILDSLAFLDILPFIKEKMSIQKVNNKSGNTDNAKVDSEEPHSPGEAERSRVNNILDIGTGGGFPLLPIAMALPETTCFGMDATGKKIAAVKLMREKLGLKNLQLITGRTEEQAHEKDLRETFDVVTARAVAEIPVLLEYAVPFLRPTGCVVLWKSVNVEEELRSSEHAEKVLITKFIQRHTYDLPEPFGKRQLLIFQKMAKTDPRYPRPVGVPKKSPL